MRQQKDDSTPNPECDLSGNARGTLTPVNVVATLPPSKGHDRLGDHDAGNARRFIALHGADVMWCRSLRDFLVFDGRRWRRDAREQVRQWAHDVADRIYDEAATLAKAKRGDDADQLWKHARRSSNSRSIEGMLGMLRAHNPVSLEELDDDSSLLNVANGTVDLRTGDIRPHDRRDRLLHLVPHPYDPNAKCPMFERAISEMMGGRADLVAFLQRWFGYCLTGETREDALALFVGAGKNGKSVLLDVVSSVIGDDLSCAAPESLLLVRSQREHPAELMALKGRRLVVASEIPKGSAFNEARLKALTTRDLISARGMGENFSTFRPTHKITIAANDLPHVRDASEGFWRRLRVVPFDVSFGERADPLLASKLKAESAGILAWLVRGCREWQRIGLGAPLAVQEATRRYRDDEDAVGAFLVDRFSDGPKRATVAEMKAAYAQWCADEGAKPLGRKAFAAELRRLGWRDTKTAQTRVWVGPAASIGTMAESDADSGPVDHEARKQAPDRKQAPMAPFCQEGPPTPVSSKEGERNRGRVADAASGRPPSDDPNIPDDLRQPLALVMERLPPEKHDACLYVARTFPDRARRAGWDVGQWQAIYSAEMARRARQ